jgi:D-alanyl-D-alanine dipeptidase
MYHGEQLVFARDAAGRSTEVVAAGIRFPRRMLAGEGAETFHITPQRPVDELRKAALAAQPPQEAGQFRQSDLVEVTAFEPGIKTDVRYFTGDNFMQTPFYSQGRVLLQRPAAVAVAAAHRALAEYGYGLMLFDGYRPWHVTKMFWDATPEASRIFVANPAEGSRHNRGCAIDLTLYELATGKSVEMTGQYDEMSERSFPDYQGGTSLQRWRRELLRVQMEAQGFVVYPYEWWHFDFADWKEYGILNLEFEAIP